MENPWHLYFMGGLYIVAGFWHFFKPKLYLRIMPRHLPYRKALIYLSGFAEILLGTGVCFPSTKNYALWGLIVMLCLFLPVHMYMFKNKKAAMGLPKWVLVLRLILQFGLMGWAFYYLGI